MPNPFNQSDHEDAARDRMTKACQFMLDQIRNRPKAEIICYEGDWYKLNKNGEYEPITKAEESE